MVNSIYASLMLAMTALPHVNRVYDLLVLNVTLINEVLGSVT